MNYFLRVYAGTKGNSLLWANRVLDLSTNIARATRLGETEAAMPSASDGIAQVTFEMRADYENGDSQDYRVTVPVQVDDEGMCSVAGQASIRKLN